MRTKLVASILVAVTALGFAACGGDESAQAPPRAAVAPPAPPPGVDAIDDARLRNAAQEPESWLTYGGTYGEQRYSSLAKIDEANVSRLGLAWAFETGSKRGLEATPLVAGGVIYTTSSWSVVFALDARSGQHSGATTPRCRAVTAGLPAATW